MRLLCTRRARGFSLLELALVVAVLGLMAGGLLGSLQARLMNLRYRETEQTLVVVEQALIGFAAAHGARLPCPDADRDGEPDRGPDGRCVLLEGDLPWAALGVGRSDAWGEALRYRPDAAFLVATGLGNPPDSLDGLQVADASDGSRLTLGNPHGPGAIVFSCGRNRMADGANAAEGATGRCNAGGTPDERYEQGRPGERFDDVLIWVSKNVALSRLIDAGAWPH